MPQTLWKFFIKSDYSLLQLGGPDGELAASMRYLNQRYAAPYAQVKGVLTDIGTEELAHLEIVSAILYQLTRNLTIEQIKESGFDTYFVDHTTGIYPAGASGMPFTAAYFQSKGDPVTDLVEDLAADGAALLGRPFKKLQEQLSILFEITSCQLGGRLFLYLENFCCLYGDKKGDFLGSLKGLINSSAFCRIISKGSEQNEY